MYGVRSIEPSPKLLCPLSVSGEAFRLSGGRTAPVAGTKKSTLSQPVYSADPRKINGGPGVEGREQRRPWGGEGAGSGYQTNRREAVFAINRIILILFPINDCIVLYRRG